MNVVDNLYAFLWLNPSVNNCNTYFIDGNLKILIDPGHHHLFGHIRENLSRFSLGPEDIDLVIITHGHPDHMEGVKVFEGSKAILAMLWAEAEFLRAVSPHYGAALGMPDFEPHILLKEGELKVGTLTFQVIHTPGHSSGSLCLYWPDKKTLFTGDLVFSQGVGRTDLPGGNGAEMKTSIQNISRLPIDYLCPGHGDFISGSHRVRSNFELIEQHWFSFL